MINNSATTNTSSTPAAAAMLRDDQILPEVRVIGALIVCVLVVASIILYLMPDRTKEFFAWEIHPNMTPLMMGGGYLSGAWFFIRAVRARKWHHIAWGLPAISTFTWFMGLATILHWDKFTPGHISFYAWAFLYFVTPFLVPFLYFRNRVTDPGTPDPDDLVVSAAIRQAFASVGLVLILIAVVMFLLPDFFISLWPWKLSPLTDRVVAGWFALPGVVGLGLSREPRWSGWRILLESQALGIVLILIGAARAWGDFFQDRPTTWAFVIGMSLLALAVIALYVYMDGQRRRVARKATT